MTPDPFGTDLAVLFYGADTADLDPGGGSVSGIDNLRQALTLRLLIDRGELDGLGHPLYGSRIRELLGTTLDRANRELLRRFVRQALLQDKRVADVISVVVVPRADSADAVDVEAVVTAIGGAPIALQVTLNAG